MPRCQKLPKKVDYKKHTKIQQNLSWIEGRATEIYITMKIALRFGLEL